MDAGLISICSLDQYQRRTKNYIKNKALLKRLSYGV